MNGHQLMRALILSLVLFAAACTSTQTPAPVVPQLLPAETFDWSGEPMTFSPPPVGWRREGETGGGIKGVRFVKEQSVGEAIGLGDYYVLADRHRRVQLRDLLDKFDTFDDGFAWDRAIRAAYAHTDQPFTSFEASIAESINTEVSQAAAAFRVHDKGAARSHLEQALGYAERLQFSLADVIEQTEFKPERKQEPERYQLLDRREATIAGEPAVIIDYTVKTDRASVLPAREVYVVHNSHLFIGTFIGLKENLELFDRVVASIEFPK